MFSVETPRHMYFFHVCIVCVASGRVYYNEYAVVIFWHKSSSETFVFCIEKLVSVYSSTLAVSGTLIVLEEKNTTNIYSAYRCDET